MLLGNLTRDPELRYTPNGTAVCNFGLATNRRWTTSDGDEKEAAQFHRIVAWAQLAELCAQLLYKGAKAYVGGRIQYREWTGDDNVKRQTTEIVIDDMILLSSRDDADQDTVHQEEENLSEPEPPVEEDEEEGTDKKEKSIEEDFEDHQKETEKEKESEDDKDIPF
jgi:single-strand DNA-binding protein